MSKFNVGDKVRIKGNLSECEFGYNRYMEEFVGKEATVVKVCIGGLIELDIDEQVWNWSENVLELIEKNDNMNTKIEEGNKVNESDLKDTETSKEVKDDKNDPVNHPSHYTDTKIEVMDYIEDKGFNFALGNAVKYISRAGKKDKNKTIQDLEKAEWYLNREIKRLKKLQGK